MERREKHLNTIHLPEELYTQARVPMPWFKRLVGIILRIGYSHWKWEKVQIQGGRSLLIELQLSDLPRECTGCGTRHCSSSSHRVHELNLRRHTNQTLSLTLLLPFVQLFGSFFCVLLKYLHRSMNVCASATAINNRICTQQSSWRGFGPCELFIYTTEGENELVGFKSITLRITANVYL